jgi:hypothetical protein
MRCNRQPYSITSSARASNDGGTVRPSALAVFMLITNSNFGRLLYWQIGRLGAFEDLIDVTACAAK